MTAPKRGLILKGNIALVDEVVRGEDRSCSAGWGRLGSEGWLCLRWAEAAEEDARPVAQPQLIPFDTPEPDEYWSYLETGRYDRAETVSADEALVPFIYGKAWRRWDAPVWPSLSAWERGRGSDERLGEERKFAFSEAIETDRGLVLRRRNRSVVPADEVFLYPISRFQGRELSIRPIAEGHLAGWARPYEGLDLFAAPMEDAPKVGHLDFQAEVDVARTPATADGAWVRVRGTVGADAARYARATDVAVYRPTGAPDDLRPGELWVDIELEQQVLAVLQGDAVVYITLVSSGRDDKHRGTPTGLYRTTDKAAWGDMTSRKGASDVYHVEKVPWIFHFWPRFALHGTFWHWGFGHQASHGCVNLAPRDAHWLFARLGPTLPAGWHTAYASDSNPGTLLRIREGDQAELRDRRVVPAAGRGRPAAERAGPPSGKKDISDIGTGRLHPPSGPRGRPSGTLTPVRECSCHPSGPSWPSSSSPPATRRRT